MTIIMNNETIDVEYEEIEDNKGNDNNITINADPVSSIISGFCGVVNNVTHALKEYGMCHQQEETKRAAIRADLKINLEKINAQKEIIIKELNNRHDYMLAEIQNQHELTMKALEMSEFAIKAAITSACETQNFSDVEKFMKYNSDLINARSQLSMKALNMGLTCSNNLLPELPDEIQIT